MPKVFRDKPLAEVTLRKFERPSGENTEDLVRKFCISVGLLQPGDSRDVVADILKLLLEAKKEKKFYSSLELETELKKVRSGGIAASNIRRQLLRLEKLGIIEKTGNGYRIREFMELSRLLEEHVEKFVIEPTLKRIREYAEEIDKRF
jgi:DNA-binding transcriptional ArsR family regulator